MQEMAKHYACGTVALALLVGIGCTSNKSGKSQDSLAAGQTSSQQAQAAPPRPPTLKILTKDQGYIQLLNPPKGDKVLELSTEYAQKKTEIEAKLAAIQDPELRERVSNEQWGKVNKSTYIANEEERLRRTFPAEMRAYLERNRGGWFEIGHVDYPGTDTLEISSVEASPVELVGTPSIAVDPVTMDRVYSQFRQIASEQINQQISEWRQAQSCSQRLKNVCRNLGGTREECSSPATLREISSTLAGGGIYNDCNDNPSDEEGRKVVEQAMRKDRVVLVGQGDLIAPRIDKLLLVDYDTETVLLNLDPKALTGKIKWKFACSLGIDCSNNSPQGKDYSVGESGEGTVAPSDAPSDSEQSIKEALNIWVKSFRDKDTKAQAECYAPIVETYFRWHNITREQLLHAKQKAFNGIGEIRKYDISDIRITMQPATESSDSSTIYSRADVTFQKDWDTPTIGGKTFAGKEIEKLTLASSAEGWKIVGEQELKILQVVRQ